MNKRILVFILATFISNIVKQNFLCYSCVSPYETWIGSSAFSTATAVFLASLATSPTNCNGTSAVILCTYYTAVSLLVSILALKLVWVPVVDVVSELNIILSKTVLYVNKSVFPCAGNPCIKQLGLFLGTKTATIWSTNLLGLFFLYAVSTDLLNFIGVYFYNLPKCGVFARMRAKALKFINTMLCIVSSKKYVRFQWEPEVKYYSSRLNQPNDRQKYYDKSEYM